jgi:hypothetical protein
MKILVGRRSGKYQSGNPRQQQQRAKYGSRNAQPTVPGFTCGSFTFSLRLHGTPPSSETPSFTRTLGRF